MSAHTPGPWEVADGRRIGVNLPNVTGGGYDSHCIAVTHESAHINAAANARRIVVCVNACEGLSSEALERLGTLDRASVAAAARRNEMVIRLHEVNAELLEALREGLSACSSVSMARDRRVLLDGCVSYRQTEEWCKWVEEEIAPKLRAAIAKATGAAS